MSVPLHATTGASAPELPSACPGCARDHSGDRAQGGGRWLAWDAHARAAEVGRIPTGAISAAEPRMVLTRFVGGGVTGATGGVRWEGSLLDLEQLVRASAALVVAKGEGDYFAEAELRGGRRRDRDAASWTAETIDVDGVEGCDWGPLQVALRAAGLGALLWRSASHTPEAPRWRCLIPFAAPVPFTVEGKAEWSARRAWLLGWVSALAGLPGVGRDYSEGKGAPACGADLRGKSGPGQPVYLPSRRSAAQDLPAVIRIEGGALDLERFLELTGYHAARSAWLEREASKPPAVRPERAAGVAGEPRATVDQLPPEFHEEIEGYARRWASAFDACGDRHDAEFAIGGYLARRGVAVGIVRGLVELLAPNDPSRGRSAADSAETALAGGRAKGLPTVRKLMGEEAAAELRELAEILGARARAERDELLPFDHERERGTADESEAHEVLARFFSEDGPRGLLDASPTGTGKSYGLCGALVEALGGEEQAGKVYVAAERHEQHDEETLPRIREAEQRLGRRLRVAKHEPFECPLPGAIGESNTRSWGALAAQGWSPVATICGGCEHFPGRPGRDPDEPACSTWVERIEARAAPVQLAMHQHVPFLDLGPNDRVIFDEDPTPMLAPEVRLDAAKLDRFERQVHERLAFEAAGRISRERSPGVGEQLLELVEAARVGVGALRVALALAPGWARLEPPEGLAGLLEPAAVRAGAEVMADAEAPNLLPALVALARAGEGGLPVRRIESRRGRPSELALTVRVELPAETRVMVLDATADAGAVERLLGREVEVLRRRPGPARGGPVLQLVDKFRARSSFEGRDGERQLEQDARLIARFAQRCVRRGGSGERVKVAVVTHKGLEEQLGKLVRAALHSLRSRDQRTPRVELRHWGALRGSNGFADVHVGILHSAPIPPPEVLERLALLRFPDAALGDLTAAPEWKRFDYRGAEAGAWWHPSEPVRWAWKQVVGAELVQGLGRFDRGEGGDGLPAGGVMIMNGVPFATIGEVTTTTEADLCLGDHADRALARAEGLVRVDGHLPRSGLALARAVNCSRRDADRIRLLIEGGCRQTPPATGHGQSRPKVHAGTGLAGAQTARFSSSTTKEPYHLGSGSADPLQQLASLLTVRRAASALAVSWSSLKRYLSGEREAPAEVLARAVELLVGPLR